MIAEVNYALASENVSKESAFYIEIKEAVQTLNLLLHPLTEISMQLGDSLSLLQIRKTPRAGHAALTSSWAKCSKLRSRT